MSNIVLRYVESLCEALEVDYRLNAVKLHRAAVANLQDVDYHNQKLDEIREGTYNYRIGFKVEETRKYYKILMNDSNSTSVSAFVDKETGEVYKPASFKAPAKGVRFNLLDKNSREECYRRADWAGGYLYAR